MSTAWTWHREGTGPNSQISPIPSTAWTVGSGCWMASDNSLLFKKATAKSWRKMTAVTSSAVNQKKETHIYS